MSIHQTIVFRRGTALPLTLLRSCGEDSDPDAAAAGLPTAVATPATAGAPDAPSPSIDGAPSATVDTPPATPQPQPEPSLAAPSATEQPMAMGGAEANPVVPPETQQWAARVLLLPLRQWHHQSNPPKTPGRWPGHKPEDLTALGTSTEVQ